jgi:tripeptide aminopeptidase
VIFAALLVAATAMAAEAPLPVATSQPDRVRRALELAAAGHEASVQQWIEICRVPALPGHEAARAKAYARMLDAAGLPARVLPDGNVEARWPGTEPGAPAVLSAHLDALHAPTAEHPIRRTRDALFGAGVLDDGSGLAAILSAVRALKAAGWQPRRELRIVATVREEVGLVGARSYVAAHPDLAAFVSIDGILGRVDHGATGIRWTRWTLTGPGGHSLLTGQVPSPSVAAGRAIAGLADLAESTEALLNVSGLSGPAAPNAIPTEVSFTVDLRADDQVQLLRLSAEADRIVREAASSEGAGVRAETLQDLKAARLPGIERSPLVTRATAILRHVGVAPLVSPRGSSDHNVALLRGIPAIAVGATTGRNAHAPEETAEIAPFAKGCGQAVLLCVLLGEGLDETGASAQ